MAAVSVTLFCLALLGLAVVCLVEGCRERCDTRAWALFFASSGLAGMAGIIFAMARRWLMGL